MRMIALLTQLPLALVMRGYCFSASWYVLCCRSRRRLAPPGGLCTPDVTPTSELFAVSADAKLLYFGGNWDNSLRVYSIARFKQVACVIRHQGFLCSVVLLLPFSHCFKVILCTQFDQFCSQNIAHEFYIIISIAISLCKTNKQTTVLQPFIKETHFYNLL